MGYIHDFERELRARLDAGDMEGAVTFAKAKALESYRNGVEVGSRADAGEARNTKRYTKRAPQAETQNAGT